MVRCANQSYIVHFAHGLLPAWELPQIVRRRWLYNFDLDLYSRPHGQLHPRARGNVYSRPRAESGVSAAFSFGCQKSGRKNLIDIVYFLSSRYRPGPPKSWEGAWTKWRRVGSPTVLHPACVKSPYIIVPRQGHTFPNHEISKMAKSGRVVVRLTHEYRICLSSL